MPPQEVKHKKTRAKSTQQYLPIAEIREDTVILKTGGLRAVLLVSSINFDLKSEEEQNATIGAYVGFLNSLQFPLQIVVQSRKLDIDEYINQVKDIQKKQVNELLRVQTAEYAQYVGELVKEADIMTKRYYMVIPYDPAADSQQSFWSKVQRAFAPGADVRLSREDFARRSDRLNKRVSQVENAVSSVGLQVQRLDTQSLVELYYTTYNPQMSEAQPLPDLGKLDIELPR